MSPTLLELLVAGVLLVVAWQLGIALAPWLGQQLRQMGRDLDAASRSFDAHDDERRQER